MTLYYGNNFKWFVGVVKERTSDKVRVRIFGIHRFDDQERLSDGDLPWAIVMYPVTGNQINSGSPTHDLERDTWVLGFFADGDDCRHPIVIGSLGAGLNSPSSPGSPGSFYDSATGAGPSLPGTSQGGGTGTPLSSRSIENSRIPGAGAKEKIYNFFYDKLSQYARNPEHLHTMVSAVVGNIQAESSFNPGAINTGEQAVGLAQWRLTRRRNLERFAGVARGVIPDFDTQVAFIWAEMTDASIGIRNQSIRGFQRLISSNNLREAVSAMCIYEYNASITRGSTEPSQSSSAWIRVHEAAITAKETMRYTGNRATPNTGDGRLAGRV